MELDSESSEEDLIMARAVIIWGLLLFSVSAWSSGQPNQYQQLVNKNAVLWHLPVELILGVIYVESRFNPIAVSPKGAIGLMQVVPESGGRETWRQLFNEDRAPSRQLLKDPGSNIMIGTAYLAHLYHNYFRDVRDNDIRIIAALAGYNWGPSRVKQMLQQHVQPRSMMVRDHLTPPTAYSDGAVISPGEIFQGSSCSISSTVVAAGSFLKT